MFAATQIDFCVMLLSWPGVVRVSWDVELVKTTQDTRQMDMVKGCAVMSEAGWGLSSQGCG